jgi:hypothetical protein
MKKRLSRRQKAYRKYLLTDEWKALRMAVIERDGKKCVECGTDKLLQVHHKIYRMSFRDALMTDLETRCSKCHCLAHINTPGLTPDFLDQKLCEMEHQYMISMNPVRPSDISELIPLVEYADQAQKMVNLIRTAKIQKIFTDRPIEKWKESDRMAIYGLVYHWARKTVSSMMADAGLEAIYGQAA